MLDGELIGDGSVLISQIGTLARAGRGEIAFLANPRYRKQLAATAASAVIVPPGAATATSLPRIVHADPYACYARLVAILNPPAPRPPGIHASAVVESPLPASASVGANAVIGQAVLLGENVTIHPGVLIGDRVSIGADSVIHPGAVIRDDCIIGARAVIQSGAVIGGDGFGFARDDGRWLKIVQIGRVVIGDDVEIGANTTVDRGAIDDTIIADGVKLDNQIQIAHNVRIGANAALAGCVGVAGSTSIGARCTVGGAGMIIGHLEIADDVHISAGSMVTKNLPRAGQYTSIYPLEEHADWLRNAAQLKRLAKLAERVLQLEAEIEQLRESHKNDQD